MGIEHFLSSDSVAVAKQPPTMGRRVPLLTLRMSNLFVHCYSLGGSKPFQNGVRTWTRLEKTHKNRLESTP